MFRGVVSAARERNPDERVLRSLGSSHISWALVNLYLNTGTVSWEVHMVVVVGRKDYSIEIVRRVGLDEFEHILRAGKVD